MVWLSVMCFLALVFFGALGWRRRWPESGRNRASFAVVTAVAVLVGGQVSVKPLAIADENASPNPKSAEKEQSVLAGNNDTLWMTSGDSAGLHVLTLTPQKEIEPSWQTVATLQEDGFDTDRWIGNACLMGDKQTLNVVYAPRSFQNSPQLSERGGFVAQVNIATGKITKAKVTASLAYYSPSCGAGKTTTFVQEKSIETAKETATRFLTLDDKALETSSIEVKGQLTSGVMTGKGLVAVRGNELVMVNSDASVGDVVATAKSTPFSLQATSDKQLVFATASENETEYWLQKLDQPHSFEPQLIASGKKGESSIVKSPTDQMIISGAVEQKMANLPENIALEHLEKPAHGISLNGEMLLGDVKKQAETVRGAESDTESAIEVAVVARSARKSESLALQSSPTSGAQDISPALQAVKGNQPQEVDPGRSCAVARTDPKGLATQPKPRQIEWAVNQALQSGIKLERPANWNSLGMSAYKPAELFPEVPLSGGGKIPAQIVLAIAAQESNMWQTPGYVVPGDTGDPLIGNYYGRTYNDTDFSLSWEINWAKADCGYGVMQVTDGMRRPGQGSSFPLEVQRKAVAYDYVANVAAGMQILAQKWNQVHDAGLKINDGQPEWIENWFYAAWAYNSGFHPVGQASNWGMGWFNNPANPRYRYDRKPFLDQNSYVDATHPQDWPYQEKIMGWAAWPPELVEAPGKLVSGYRAAWWNTDDFRSQVRPNPNFFCDESNDCSNTSADKCSIKGGGENCWFHKSVKWKNECKTSCGNTFIRFPDGYAYQDDGIGHPSNCNAPGEGKLAGDGLPGNALIIDDDKPRSDQSCGGSSGTFEFKAEGNPAPAKIDLQQIGGAGYGGHFWFSHTRYSNDMSPEQILARKITGTWTLGEPLNGWGRVMVHMPAYGAHSRDAQYTVHSENGPKTRVLQQRIGANEWRSLGVFKFNGTARVELSNIQNRLGEFSPDKDGNSTFEPGLEDVAWDAVAFQPLSKKPDEIIVSMGDSYSSGEGASPSDGSLFYPETDISDARGGVKGQAQWRNVCHRSKAAWSRKMLSKTGKLVGEVADELSDKLEHSFLACSGAVADNFDRKYHNGEPPQFNKGYLDENTTLVTFSIGGNDAGFSDIFKRCISKDCQNVVVEEGFLPFIRTSSKLGEAVPLFIDYDSLPSSSRGGLRERLNLLIKEINNRAPHAKILLVGYPHLITDLKSSGHTGPVPPIPESCVVGLITPLSSREWFRLLSTQLNAAMKKEVELIISEEPDKFSGKIAQVNPISEFKGYELCHPVNKTHIVDVNSSKTPGETELVTSQSLHPNTEGTTDYANAVNRVQKAMGWIS